MTRDTKFKKYNLIDWNMSRYHHIVDACQGTSEGEFAGPDPGIMR